MKDFSDIPKMDHDGTTETDGLQCTGILSARIGG